MLSSKKKKHFITKQGWNIIDITLFHQQNTFKFSGNERANNHFNGGLCQQAGKYWKLEQ